MSFLRLVRTVGLLCLQSTDQLQDFVQRTTSAPDKTRFSFLDSSILDQEARGENSIEIYIDIKHSAKLGAMLRRMISMTVLMEMVAGYRGSGNAVCHQP